MHGHVAMGTVIHSNAEPHDVTCPPRTDLHVEEPCVGQAVSQVVRGDQPVG